MIHITIKVTKYLTVSGSEVVLKFSEDFLHLEHEYNTCYAELLDDPENVALKQNLEKIKQVRTLS